MNGEARIVLIKANEAVEHGGSKNSLQMGRTRRVWNDVVLGLDGGPTHAQAITDGGL